MALACRLLSSSVWDTWDLTADPSSHAEVPKPRDLLPLLSAALVCWLAVPSSGFLIKRGRTWRVELPTLAGSRRARPNPSLPTQRPCFSHSPTKLTPNHPRSRTHCRFFRASPVSRGPQCAGWRCSSGAFPPSLASPGGGLGAWALTTSSRASSPRHPTLVQHSVLPEWTLSKKAFGSLLNP